MTLWIIRAMYVLILAGTAAKITDESIEALKLSRAGAVFVFCGIVLAGIVIIVIDVLTQQKKIGTISAVFFGLLIGTILGNLLSLAFGPTLRMWASDRLTASVTLVITIILCYLCISLLLQTKDDFRFLIPYVEFSRQLKGGRPLILDTSVIIDGRIADIADTGILDQTVVVPGFVLQELQNIADSTEKLRRSRGRRGLDVLDRLKKCEKIVVQMHEIDGVNVQKREVDVQLIALATQLNGKLVTNDVNLAKSAKIHNVETINVNDLTTAAKPPVSHGDTLAVRLVKEGEEPGQGIGYLDDGTMVVAEMGRNFVGTEVNLVVTSVLQTHAGRMVFGRIDSKNPEPAKVSQRG